MGKHSEVAARGRWRRVAAAGAFGLTAAVVGVAGAAPTSTTDVTFVPLAPTHKVLSNATIAANKTSSPVVIGGSTTVPTNATTVQLVISAKGAAGGTLVVYPAGNAAASPGRALSYPAGNVLQTATVASNIGKSNEVTVLNRSTGSAVVSVTITGYSTQLTASGISGSGGQPGDVLTDNGTGAQWGPPGGAGYASTQPRSTSTPLSGTPTTVASLAVPAGTYQVSATGTASNYADQTYVNCTLLSPAGQQVTDAWVSLAPASVGGLGSFSLTGLMMTSGGTVSLSCFDYVGVTTSSVADVSLVAVQVSSASGSVASQPVSRTGLRSLPGR